MSNDPTSRTPTRPPRRRRHYVALLILLLVNVAIYASVMLDHRAMAKVAFQVIPRGSEDCHILQVLTRYVRDELHHCDRSEVETMPALRRWNYLYNPFRIGPRTALEHGGHYGGSCGSSSRVLMELLRPQGIDSRFVILLDDNLDSLHTLLEVHYDGVWGAVDPLYGIVYQYPGGIPASMRDLREDHELFVANATRGWEYGYGPDRKQRRHAYNMEKYTFDHAHYFNFGKFGAIGKLLHKVLRRVFGEQATFWIRRPNFYAYPALTTVFLIDCLAAFVAMLWLIRSVIRRRSRHPMPAAHADIA